ncbi:uncharacterized protein LOC111399971 [Olea europaea var. sylvestris]|uniref:uncharacterized protein LOC111399971 n=1 Tax=Olea europaea var. sylvestris TaxID=158386 RepID=UPI000C1D3334|nr:uncharacterized protein LOC111399971 [Olea europaea var. sylvestris]
MSSLTNQIAASTSHGSQKKAESILATSTAYQKAKRENEQLQYVNDQHFNKKENYSGNNYYQGNHASERKPSLEDILGTFISESRSRFNKDKKGNFSSDMEVNPREHCNAITLRNGKVVKERKPREVVVPISDHILVREKQTEKQKIEAEVKKKIYKPYSILFSDNPPILKPPLPFPQKYLKKEFDEKFVKLLEIFKKIHVNIPFAEALAQMPNYAKFVKEVMSKKRKLEEFENIKLTGKCRVILQKKLPHKLKDLGSFNIPCNIGGTTFDRTLQIDHISQGHYRRCVDKVDKFIFSVDFVVFGMEEDEKVSLILSRPFLATERALIDVREGKLTLQANEEQVIFNIHQEKKAQKKEKLTFAR